MTGQQEFARIENWLGDYEAAVFVCQVAAISQIADDFVDGDVKKEDSSQAMVTMLELAMVGVPSSAFFRRHCDRLQPAITAALGQWHMSNRLADDPKSNSVDLMFAFTWRHVIETVFYVTAHIIGGTAFACEAAAKAYQYHHRDTGETFEDWNTERLGHG